MVDALLPFGFQAPVVPAVLALMRLTKVPFDPFAVAVAAGAGEWGPGGTAPFSVNRPKDAQCRPPAE